MTNILIDSRFQGDLDDCRIPYESAAEGMQVTIEGTMERSTLFSSGKMHTWECAGYLLIYHVPDRDSVQDSVQDSVLTISLLSGGGFSLGDLVQRKGESGAPMMIDLIRAPKPEEGLPDYYVSCTGPTAAYGFAANDLEKLDVSSLSEGELMLLQYWQR